MDRTLEFRSGGAVGASSGPAGRPSPGGSRGPFVARFGPVFTPFSRVFRASSSRFRVFSTRPVSTRSYAFFDRSRAFFARSCPFLARSPVFSPWPVQDRLCRARPAVFGLGAVPNSRFSRRRRCFRTSVQRLATGTDHARGLLFLGFTPGGTAVFRGDAAVFALRVWDSSRAPASRAACCFWA